jgi:hypothetical protein
VVLPQEYIVQKFYQYAGYPKYKKSSNTYEAGCPICREGTSWLKKRRCYYLVEDSIICCHNCGWFSKPLKWIQEVAGQTYDEIIKEARTYDILPEDISHEDIPLQLQKVNDKLPLDCINLFDTNQTEYHKNNPIVQKALELIKKRKLDTAINRPSSLWLSLTDKIHKNRLIIPFYNEKEDIVFYQSRTIINQPNDRLPKYLSKINGEKALFNLDKINPELDYIFIFEGPIDAFFVKNGTAVAGIQENSNNTFSSLQQLQINIFKLTKTIWVLDSQWLDSASRIKTKRLIDQGETVFIWPEKVGTRYKDFNDACIAAGINEISSKFILDNSYSGLKAKLLMSEIKS